MESVSVLKVVLYTREGCHLCDEARKVLGQFNIVPHLVDIDQDPALREQFGTCVPVVEIDGRIRFRGGIEKKLMRRIVSNCVSD